MKLEMKHLAPYLPYGLSVLIYDAEKVYQSTRLEIKGERKIKLNSSWIGALEGVHGKTNHRYKYPKVVDRESYHHTKMIMPILRPLSDLTKIHNEGQDDEYTHIRELFTSYDSNKHEVEIDRGGASLELWLKYGEGFAEIEPEILTLNDYLYLFKKHYDVFGLIPAGLAIDINTIN